MVENYVKSMGPINQIITGGGPHGIITEKQYGTGVAMV
jgi:hypothetical protein